MLLAAPRAPTGTHEGLHSTLSLLRPYPLFAAPTCIHSHLSQRAALPTLRTHIMKSTETGASITEAKLSSSFAHRVSAARTVTCYFCSRNCAAAALNAIHSVWLYVLIDHVDWLTTCFLVFGACLCYCCSRSCWVRPITEVVLFRLHFEMALELFTRTTILEVCQIKLRSLQSIRLSTSTDSMVAPSDQERPPRWKNHPAEEWVLCIAGP